VLQFWLGGSTHFKLNLLPISWLTELEEYYYNYVVVLLIAANCNYHQVECERTNEDVFSKSP
jgi:hypothetical protein